MIPEERRKNILALLKENEFLNADILAEKLQVSKITILRDFQKLKEQGDISKIHGGIKLNSRANNNFESGFYSRMQKNYSRKLDIAKKSIAYITYSQTVFLDSSSTVFVFASEIFKKSKGEKNLITNSPAIISEAINFPQVNIISTGGELKQEFNIFGGAWVNEFLEKINIDSAFISAAGISQHGKITTNNKDLSAILSLIFKRSKEINLLADSSKFFMEGMLNIAHLSNCRRLITDSDIDPDKLSEIKKISDIEVIF